MPMRGSEFSIFNLLSKFNKKTPEYKWEYFEVFGEDGKTTTYQSKLYPPPAFRAAYPDFEKYKMPEHSLVLLVEVKDQTDYYENCEGMLAMKRCQFNQYFTVQDQEKVKVRVVFALNITGSHWHTEYYWETLDNLKRLPHIDQIYEGWSYGKKKTETYCFWNVCDLRSDVENLGI